MHFSKSALAIFFTAGCLTQPGLGFTHSYMSIYRLSNVNNNYPESPVSPKSQPKRNAPFHLSLSAKDIEDMMKEQNDSPDRAPCFDTVCDSIPVITTDLHQNNTIYSSDTTSVSTETTATATTKKTTHTTSNENTQRGEATLRLGDMTGPTVWSEFGRIAQENKVANLGQGFPDWLPPKFAVDSIVEASTDSLARSPHQYTRTAGHPNLVKMLAARYSIHLKRTIDPMGEVAVTVGASQALYLSLQTLVKPGDEVILFEPFFDLYVNQVKLAGGTPVYVPLTFVPYDNDDASNGSISGGEWILEADRLRDAITPNTRAIVLNSPHNPTGKLFSRAEMESIASAVEEKASDRCVVLSDEVYKYIVHSPPKDESTDLPHDEMPAIRAPGHTHFASLPNMYDRTITISSAGKTFSATGWQVGWCIGPPQLIGPIHQILPYVQFCASTVIQETLARTLQKAEEPYEGFSNYYEYLKSSYTQKRDLLGKALKKAGFGIPDYDITPGGGFFIFARIGPDILNALPKDRINASNPAAPGGATRADWALCQWMAEEKGVLCIPSSPFFSREKALEGASDQFIRIAFCKTEETIDEAALAFMKLRGEDHTDTDKAEGNREEIPIVVVNDHINDEKESSVQSQSVAQETLNQSR